MRILLDTHTFIWFLEGDRTIPPSSRELIEDRTNQCFISSVSLWEMTVKSSLGKLEMSIDLNQLSQLLTDLDIELLPIRIEHLSTLATLPFHHRDPFDRLIIAQAISESKTLISNDNQFEKYPVSLNWK